MSKELYFNSFMFVLYPMVSLFWTYSEVILNIFDFVRFSAFLKKHISFIKKNVFFIILNLIRIKFFFFFLMKAAFHFFYFKYTVVSKVRDFELTKFYKFSSNGTYLFPFCLCIKKKILISLNCKIFLLKY